MNDQFYTEESANTDIPNLRSIRIPVKISVDSINDDVGSTVAIDKRDECKLFSAIGFILAGNSIKNKCAIGLISVIGWSTIEAGW